MLNQERKPATVYQMPLLLLLSFDNKPIKRRNSLDGTNTITNTKTNIHTVVRSHFHRPTFSVLFGTHRRTDHALSGFTREPFVLLRHLRRRPAIKDRKRVDEI